MNYYDLDSLSRALGKLEERYGLPSDQFMDAHRDDAPAVQGIPGFVRHLWASLFLDVERMRGSGARDSGFVEGMDHALALNQPRQAERVYRLRFVWLPSRIVARTLHEYMEDRKRECAEFSLHLNDHPVFAAEAGSEDKRGRILLTLNMTERANLEVSEWIEVRGNSVHRLEYAYYLVLDGREYWARDFDSIHGYHGHTLGHRRIDADRVTFKEAAEMAWEIVSQEEELTGTEPVEFDDD